MIALQIVASGNLEENFAKFTDNAPKLVDKTIRIVAYRYRKHVLTNYISGQYLDSKTGLLKKSIIVGKKKRAKFVYLVGTRGVKDKSSGTYNASSVKLANIFEHDGGYTISPKNKKAVAFKGADGNWVFVRGEIRVASRPFMTDAARAFPWQEKFAQTTEEVIVKELKRLEKENIYIPGGAE